MSKNIIRILEMKKLEHQLITQLIIIKQLRSLYKYCQKLLKVILILNTIKFKVIKQKQKKPKKELISKKK